MEIACLWHTDKIKTVSLHVIDVSPFKLDITVCIVIVWTEEQLSHIDDIILLLSYQTSESDYKVMRQ